MHTRQEKEVSSGGAAPRILSLDPYFMTEVEKVEKDPDTGRRVKKKVGQSHSQIWDHLYFVWFLSPPPPPLMFLQLKNFVCNYMYMYCILLITFMGFWCLLYWRG